VIFTVSSYLLGKCLFVGSDGFLRDAAEDHGKSHGGDLMERVVPLVVSCASGAGAAGLVFYVDSPVAHSGMTAELLRHEMGRQGMRGEALLVRSPDHELKELRRGVAASSDSAVIDVCRVPVLDLARLVLEARFRPHVLRLDQCGLRPALRGAFR
jgi:hypothetical protein